VVRTIHISIAVAWVVLLASSVFGQEIRLANGVIVKGDVTKLSDAGLELQTTTGTRTYSWETLSPATRFRYQAVFRANFETIAQGLPPSARNNVPDPTEIAQPQAPKAKEETSATAQPTNTASVQSLKIFDQASYDNVEPITIAKFPGLQLRNPNLASFIGLQYGPGKDEVVYLAADTRGSSDLPDQLFVYSPGAAAYTNTVKFGGMKKVGGEYRMFLFKKFLLTTRFGQIQASFEVECSSVAGQTNALNVSIVTQLSKGETKNRFILNGQLTDMIQGSGIINVKGILDLPVLWLGLDLSSGAPRLVGNLNMSHLKMLPKEGMDNKVAIAVAQDKTDILRESLRLEDNMFAQKYGIVCDLKKTVVGQSYNVSASIDLGPFLGPASFEEPVTIPKAGQ